MSELTKVRIKADGHVVTFGYYPRFGTLLSQVIEQTEIEDLTEDGFEVLPESEHTKDDILQHIINDMEGANYHREMDIVENAVEYMTDEKAIEWLKQLNFYK